ncbi:exo-alpha-sialidase [Lutibacter sp.]
MKKIVVVISFLLVVSCDKKEHNQVQVQNTLFESPIAVTNTDYNAMGAYFNLDSEDNILLNWSEEVDSAKTHVLKYKVFNTATNKFGKTITVTSSLGLQPHHESMAKIAKTASGVLYAIFRIKVSDPKNRFAGNIYYATSEDNGKSWSVKRKLVQVEGAMSQSFYDVALLPDGELGLCWLDSRKIEKDKNGSTLFFAKTKGNLGFFDEKPIAGSTCQCCRTDLFVSPDNSIHIGYRNITEGSIRDMYSVSSTDNGASFSTPVRMGIDNWKIDGCPHTGPSFANNLKDLAVTWFTGADSGAGIFFKNLSDEMLLPESKLLITTVGRHPQMTALPNGNFYIVYEDYYKVEGQTFNNIVLHVIKKDGTELNKIISPYNSVNNHAVITKLGDNSLLIAWVNVDKNKSKIMYKQINL